MNKFKIVATAPTAYQLQSLREFNLDVVKNNNGSYTGTSEFETENEAKKYLIKRAIMYYDDNEPSLEDAIRDIELYSHLTLDAVTGSIEEIFEEE